MKLDADTLLTYCTNVHPAETLDEVQQRVLPHVEAVKARVCPGAPFGVGLRLSAKAAEELVQSDQLAEFRARLSDAGLFVFTLNGFPYGNFHGDAVKDAVYRPDWSRPERSSYTLQLATILAGLLPENTHGSISTVPIGFLRRTTPAQQSHAARALVDVAAELWRIRERTDRHIALALEPEPWCVLETTADAITYFEDELLTSARCEQLARQTGLTRAQAEHVIRAHVGVCLDACHAAVAHEHAEDSLAALERHGIAVPKLQISAGLEVPFVTPEHLRALAKFADPVYLHQVFVRYHDRPASAGFGRFLDLDRAIWTCDPSRPQTWRIHFHVPVFTETLGEFRSTQAFLVELLGAVRRRTLRPHLEVETYTWSVLPPEHRTMAIDSAIACELQWVEQIWRE